jgi:adenine phosphoribosyltransferase
MTRQDLYRRIRSVPDFPREGILFRDITTLLSDAQSLKSVLREFSAHFRAKGIGKVAAIESRGFIFGSLLAYELDAGLVLIRKGGKLPAEVYREEYALEYGTDRIEMHRDALSPGEKVLLHDDLLATGGTAEAACRLIRQGGGEIVGASFLIELSFLNGASRLGCEVFSLLQYEAE